MGSTIKIVIEGYPVEKLPEELRARLVVGQPVRITLEQDEEQPKPLSELYGCHAGLYAAQGVDPADFIRQLRDEWD